MRAQLAQRAKLHERQQQNAWFLSAAETYCQALEQFAPALRVAQPRSEGFRSLQAYLDAYLAADAYTQLKAAARATRAALDSVRYAVLIQGDLLTVSRYQDEPDYSAEVAACFERFRQAASKDYRVKFLDEPGMNHIEAKVLEFVARLFPDAFAQLTAFCETHADYLDVTLAAFDREVQFYMAYLDHMKALRPYGLNFCYPDVEAQHEHLYARETFDLALAGKLAPQGTTIVTNDFELRGKERIIIVSGPNQGGKTTFSRTFGQLHYLARLGLPVPGTAARLFLCDQIYTHYERQEDIRNQRGKLEDDLFRIHRILDAASPRSLIIMNEIFTSTTLKDALFLAHRILRQIVRLDLLCVCVTFIDELTQVSDTTVSMVSTVAPDEPARRTYKVIRRPADGLSYALSVAQKYQLDADSLERRLAR
ncbi:DNA mismatch repair protein MutS [Castellaniella caeni]